MGMNKCSFPLGASSEKAVCSFLADMLASYGQPVHDCESYSFEEMMDEVKEAVGIKSDFEERAFYCILPDLRMDDAKEIIELLGKVQLACNGELFFFQFKDSKTYRFEFGVLGEK